MTEEAKMSTVTVVTLYFCAQYKQHADRLKFVLVTVPSRLNFRRLY